MPDMRRSAEVVWVPVVLAGVTLCGLVAALIGGSAWSLAAWIALAAPLAVAAWRIAGRRRSGS